MNALLSKMESAASTRAPDYADLNRTRPADLQHLLARIGITRDRPFVRRRLRAAWALDDHDRALDQLRVLAERELRLTTQPLKVAVAADQRMRPG